MTKTKKPKKGMILIGIGFILVLAAAVIGGYFLWESHHAEAVSQEVLTVINDEIKDADSPFSTDNPNRSMPTIEVKGKRYVGTISIPSLDIELPVMEEWSYDNLKRSPCRYSGTVYANNMVIAAHNYRSHFGNLKNLNRGAKVIFTDTEGNVYQYEVASLETLLPTQVDEMTSGDWGLTLFTCTPGGKTRVTVRCNAV